LDTTFLTIFSMPMFSVSTLPTMHSPAGASRLTVSASATLPSVVTATGASGSVTK